VGGAHVSCLPACVAVGPAHGQKRGGAGRRTCVRLTRSCSRTSLILSVWNGGGGMHRNALQGHGVAPAGPHPRAPSVQTAHSPLRPSPVLPFPLQPPTRCATLPIGRHSAAVQYD
jgi:hypothetical protein